MSETVHYYLLLLLFTVLFVLQVWAILKIREMIRRVLELYEQVHGQRGFAAPKAGAGSPRRTCQLCRHRQTFADPSGKQVLIFRCGLTQQRITLDDFCRQFEWDAHRADL